MTTITINVGNGADARKIVDALRLMRSVKDVSVSETDVEQIPGLPYTREAYMADILRSEEDYAAGRTISSEELRNRAAAW